MNVRLDHLVGYKDEHAFPQEDSFLELGNSIVSTQMPN